MSTLEKGFIRHVSFDCWGTLIKSHPLHKSARNKYVYHRLLRKGYEISREELNANIKRTEKTIDVINELSEKPLTIEECISLMYMKLGVDPDIINAKEIFNTKIAFARYFRTHYPICINRDIVYVLGQLSKMGFTMSLLCNTGFTSGKLVEEALGRLGVSKYFERLFFSDELGISKPNPRTFSTICRYKQLRPEEILHVGDNPITDGACTNIGMNSYILSESQKFHDLPIFINRWNQSQLTKQQEQSQLTKF